jgi:hypothetical protein
VSHTARAVAAAVLLWAAPFLITTAQAQVATSTATSIPAQNSVASTTLDQYNPQDVESIVRASFANEPIMVAVAKCESGFAQYDEYGNPLYGGTGGMVGVFQEAAAVHNDVARSMGLDLNTLAGNIAYAHYLYDTEGVRPWLASSKCWSPIKTSLQLGSQNSQVIALQQMLNDAGYMVAKDGPGSPGQETNAFGPATRAAVRKFQCDSGLVCKGNEKSTGYGMVGVKTRQALIVASARAAKTASAQ